MLETPSMLDTQREERPATPASGRRRRLAERLKERFFDEEDHPYVHLERAVLRRLATEHVLLEAGCGRRAELLRRFEGCARELVGLDLGEFTAEARDAAVRLVRGDIADTGLPDASVDTMISRALMEHLPEPERAFREIRRVLKPGGHYVFLAPNLGDYTAWVAKLVPNRLHPLVVRLTEGRPPEDTFPAYFRCNTRRSIRRLCGATGLELVSLEYLGQYPSYFLFNPFLFLIATGYEKLIARFERLGFLRGWLLVVLRRPEAP